MLTSILTQSQALKTLAQRLLKGLSPTITLIANPTSVTEVFILYVQTTNLGGSLAVEPPSLGGILRGHWGLENMPKFNEVARIQKLNTSVQC